MRFLFVSSSAYLPQSIGGSKLATHELCLELSAMGHEAAALCALQGDGWLFYANRVKAKLGFRSPVSDHTLGYPVYRMWSTPGAEPVEFKRAVERFNPDAVVFESGFGQRLDVVDQAVELGLKAAIYFHDVEFERVFHFPSSLEGVALIANSNYTASRLKERFGRCDCILPPIVRPERYRVKVSPEYVLHVNPHPDKGIDITLGLAERFIDTRFHIQESWSLPDSITVVRKKRAAALGNVSWSPPVSDMREVYRRAKVLLVPSQWPETWGRVVNEAQASGIPVIASDVGGLPESVASGGVLVPFSCDITVWEQALNEVIGNEYAFCKFKEKSMERVRRSDVDPLAVTKKFVEVFV